ncbi:MAG: carbamoyltransferase N-terminal domain-containing protein [Pseudomonadota bacterium]
MPGSDATARPRTGFILGLSCYYHDATAVLLRDGEVVAAAQEERFNREKYSQVLPLQALNWCLQEGGVSIDDLDAVAFYEKPYLKFGRVMIGHLVSWPFSYPNFAAMMPAWLEERLSLPVDLEQKIGFERPVYFVKHHLAHAASAFYPSPFEEAALLTVDGIGEWASASWGAGRGHRITIEQELRYPNSLGLLYSIICTYLGFQVFTGEGKVMALAAFGEPRFVDRFKQIMDLRPDGSFRLDPAYFALNRGTRMYTRRFVELFGPERRHDEPIEARHQDVAASLQAVAEEVLLAMARHVHARTGMRRLCAAGGVFLNVVANSRILAETPFEDLFVLPAAGDAGAALGAAAWVHHALGDHAQRHPLKSAYLGPGYPDRQIRRLLEREGARFRELEPEALCDEVARHIADGRIVAWFQGRMEFGPRALGARSLLADARRPDMKQVLNDRVKHREPFRPYGVSILEERAGEWFDLGHESPYMLLVGRPREGRGEQVPAALHVDGTCRLQTVSREVHPLYHLLLESFERLTGVPMVINTSYNVQEPIVCTPEQAWATFEKADIDYLAIGSFLVGRGSRGAAADQAGAGALGAAR